MKTEQRVGEISGSYDVLGELRIQTLLEKDI